MTFRSPAPQLLAPINSINSGMLGRQSSFFVVQALILALAASVAIDHNGTEHIPIHLATMWSAHHRALFELWSSSLSGAMENDGSDRKYRYTIHAEFYSREKNLTGAGVCCDANWARAAKRKVEAMHELALQLPLGSIAVFSDIDIVFFDGTLSNLWDFHRSSGNAVTFMPRFRPDMPGVNTGFYLVTVSEATRLFLRDWAAHTIRNDQDTMCRWLMDGGRTGYAREPCLTDPRWGCMASAAYRSLAVGRFPHDLAGARANDLTGAAALFHAVGKPPRLSQLVNITGVEDKVARLNDVLRTKPMWRARTPPAPSPSG